jgi:hypothetical protein
MLSTIARKGMSRSRLSVGLVCRAVTLLLVTIMLGACSDSPSQPTPQPNQNTLLLSRLLVSMVPGGIESVVIHATNDAGEFEPCTITNSNPAVASAVITDSTLRITGLTHGLADVTITSSSGKVSHLPVRVYSPYVLETADLLITYVDRYTLRWNDLGSGGSYDGSFYHPVTKDGFHALGTLGLGPDKYPNPNGTRAAMVVKAKPGHENALAYPMNYEQIYNDANSGADMFGSFWRPIPPPGYVAMGTVVANNTWNKPSLTDVVCVRSDLVMTGEVGAFIYDDRGTAANRFLSCWKIDQPNAGPHEMAYLVTGTFLAVNTWDRPSASPMLYVLKVDLPTLAEAPYQTYVPRLTSHDSPASETVPTLGKAMLVPCSIINDRLHGDVGWQVANSPMYRLERCVYYKLLYHNHNQTSETQTNTVIITSGITTSEASRVWNETAISLSAEVGVSIKAVDAKVTATVSRAMGYETETSISELHEKSVSSSINTPPGKSAALWQKYTRYVLYRHSGTQLEPVSGWELGIDSYVTDEYPH